MSQIQSPKAAIEQLAGVVCLLRVGNLRVRLSFQPQADISSNIAASPDPCLLVVFSSGLMDQDAGKLTHVQRARVNLVKRGEWVRNGRRVQGFTNDQNG